MATSLLPGNILLTRPNVVLAARNHAAPSIDSNPGEQGFRRVRLQFLRILQSTFRCVAPSARRVVVVVAGKVEMRVHARKPRPSDRKIGVKLHRPLIKTDGFLCEIGGQEEYERLRVLQKPGRADTHRKPPDCLLV